MPELIWGLSTGGVKSHAWQRGWEAWPPGERTPRYVALCRQSLTLWKKQADEETERCLKCLKLAAKYA
jgi:hypothetical protein